MTRNRTTGVAIAFCALITSVSPVRAAPVKVDLTVNETAPQPRIEPEVYGQFVENGPGKLGEFWVGEKSRIPNIHGYRTDVVKALKALKIPLIRWPGGNFADQYDWRDGIGRFDSRPRRASAMYRDLVTNEIGTHEFLNFAELIGAQPYLGINMGSMEPLHAARWLEYITEEQRSSLADERRRNGRDKPWNVKYVGLGNEVWGSGGLMTPQYAADLTRRFSAFVNYTEFQRSHRNFYKIASGPTGNFPQLEEYTDTMMKNNPSIIGFPAFDALSLHYYTWITDKDGAPSFRPAAGLTEATWAQALSNALKIDGCIAKMSQIMDKYDPKKSVAIAVDEYGSWSWQSSMLSAEVTALSLNDFHRHTDRVKIANNSMMINSFNAIILTRKDRMLLTPVYYVFQMYKPFKGATPYPVKVKSGNYRYGDVLLPRVDASAARTAEGKLVLALVNLDPNETASVETNLSGLARGTLLAGSTVDASNTFDKPNAVKPSDYSAGRPGQPLKIELPARSIVVVEVVAP
jgi:alpha-N-arabinofuranosidase